MCFLLGAQADEIGDEGGQSDNLTAVMESMGIYDTDLRARGNTNASAVNETQRLLKILLATLNKAVAQGSMSVQSNHGEPSTGSGRVEPAFPDPDLRKQNEPASQTNYTEVRFKRLILGLLFWNIFPCIKCVCRPTNNCWSFLCLGGHGL